MYGKELLEFARRVICPKGRACAAQVPLRCTLAATGVKYISEAIPKVKEHFSGQAAQTSVCIT